MIQNPEFKEYDKIITADYPIYNEKAYKYDEIEFIRRYVNSIYLENQFCQKFRIEKIEDLLLGYSENYQKLVIWKITKRWKEIARILWKQF